MSEVQDTAALTETNITLLACTTFQMSSRGKEYLVDRVSLYVALAVLEFSKSESCLSLPPSTRTAGVHPQAQLHE